MDVIVQIGAYTGFAAVIGLGVLSALYFSQARDVRRLREWAARMSASGGQPATESRSQTAAGAGAASLGASSSDLREASGAAAVGTGAPAPSTPLGLRLPNRSSDAVSPAAGSPAAGNARGAPAPRRGEPAPRAINGGPAGRRTSRSSLPYMVLAVVGVLIVIGGGAFAIGLIGDGGPAPEVTAGGSTGSPAPMPDPRSPASVTFSVLNGTGVAGQARQVADELEAAGYRRGNVTNASSRRAESGVLYAQGARPEALAVARRLQIRQTEAIDSASQTLAGDASVVVVVGADQTR